MRAPSSKLPLPKLKKGKIYDGFYNDVSHDDYLAAEGISSSAVKQLNVSSWEYYARRAHPEWYEKESRAMIFGTALHAAILEPQKFEAVYLMRKKFSGTGSRDKQKAWDDEMAGAGLIWLHEAEWRDLSRILQLHDQNAAIQSLFKHSLRECSFFWKDADGVHKKIRPDAIKVVGDTAYVLDLKSTAGIHDWGRQCANMGYDITAALYQEGAAALYPDVKEVRYMFIPIEKTAPYHSAVYELGPESLHVARNKIQRAVTRYKRGMEFDIWPSILTDGKYQTVEMPTWELNDGRIQEVD